jgi:hypothetical protein
VRRVALALAVVLLVATAIMVPPIFTPAVPKYDTVLIKQTDSIYTRDTLALTRWRIRYDSIRDTLRLTDTVRVKAALETADSALVTCSTAVVAGEARVAARDKAIDSLRRQITAGAIPTPRLSRFAQALYSPVSRDVDVTLGADLRLGKGFSAIVAANAVADTIWRGNIRVGFRKVF